MLLLRSYTRNTMDDPAAQRIIDAIQALKFALQQAPAVDRSMATILCAADLQWIFDSATAANAHFDRAFCRTPMPPRVLAG
jgi:hypothetical protein